MAQGYKVQPVACNLSARSIHGSCHPVTLARLPEGTCRRARLDCSSHTHIPPPEHLSTSVTGTRRAHAVGRSLDQVAPTRSCRGPVYATSRTAKCQAAQPPTPNRSTSTCPAA